MRDYRGLDAACCTVQSPAMLPGICHPRSTRFLLYITERLYYRRLICQHWSAMHRHPGQHGGGDSYTHVGYRRNPNAGVGGCCNQICGSLMSECPVCPHNHPGPGNHK